MNTVELKSMTDDELRADVSAWLKANWKGGVTLPKDSWERSPSLDACQRVARRRHRIIACAVAMSALMKQQWNESITSGGTTRAPYSKGR